MIKLLRMRSKSAVLCLIFALALFLRLYQLDRVPVELFGDELDAGYQAYSILKTGKDLRGYRLPLYFHSLSEYRAPLYLYATVPFVAIFGLNEWGVRLPAAFFGLVNIFLLYLVVKELFKNETLALFAAFLLTVTPWHLQYSRAGFEVTLLLSFVLAGIYLFLRAGENKYFFPLSCLFFVLAVYTYSTGALFVILMTPFLYFYQKEKSFKKIGKKPLFIGLLILFFGLTPLLIGLATGQAGERFSQISIFKDQKLIENVINKRGAESSVGRLFHNKATEIGKEFVKNYLNAFSPDFLFLRGDPNLRHSVATTGELYLIYLPFLIYGFVSIIKGLNKKENQLILFWLLVSPIPSALTVGGGNHATRLFLLLPALIVLVAIGLVQSIKLANKLKYLYLSLLCFLFLVLFFNFLSYAHQYYFHWPVDSWQFWHYGYREAILSLAEIDGNYEKVILNNHHEPILIRLLFWAKKDPVWFHQNFTIDKETSGLFPGFDGFKVGKYYFGHFQKGQDLERVLDSKTLYLAFQKDEIPGDWDWSKNPPAGIKALKLVKNPLGDPYLYLLTGTK